LALLSGRIESALQRARHVTLLQVPASGSVLVEMPVTPSTPELANETLLLDPRAGYITEISDVSGEASERQSVEDYLVQDPSEEGSLRLSLCGGEADLEETKAESNVPEQAEGIASTSEDAVKGEESTSSQVGMQGKCTLMLRM
jgi:hypothetical protein